MEIEKTVQKATSLLMVAIVVFLVAELMAYCWHRFLVHDNILSRLLTPREVRLSHRFHHESDLTHEATEDFIWILLGLSVAFFLFGIAYWGGYCRGIPRSIILVVISVTIFVFSLNWYVHRAAHREGHWTRRFGFVRDLSEIHMVHHRDPHANYSIINLADPLFGTFSCGFPYTEREVLQILRAEKSMK